MSTQQGVSDQVLSIVISRAIYPITEGLLHQIFDPYGVEQLVVYPPIIPDGDPCVAADVRFRSWHAAAQAFADWDGRCIYYRCCCLQMWCASSDVLPALPSAAATPTAASVLHEDDDDLTASAPTINFEPVATQAAPVVLGTDNVSTTDATAASVASDVNILTASSFTGSLVWSSSNVGTHNSSWPSTHEDAQEMFEPMTGRFDKSQDTIADGKEHKDDTQESVIPLFLNPSAWYEQHLISRGPCFASLDAQLVFEEYMRSVDLEMRLAWPPLVEANFGELCSLGQFDSDSTLSLYPWNPGGYLLKNRTRMTMVFITASSGSHWHVTCVIEEFGQCFSQIAKIQRLLPICLKMRTQCLVLVPFANPEYELWRPPDRTKIRGVLVKFGRLQVFLVSSVKLQPWPSWQLTFLVSTELSNCCDEMIFPILKYSPNTTVLFCFSCHAIASTIVCSAGKQAITLASYSSFAVTKFKPLSQMELLMVRANCDAMSDSETWSLFSCSLFTGWPCELIIARTGSHATSRNTKQLIGAGLTSQQQKSTINLRSYSCWNWSFPLPIHAHIHAFSGLKWYLQIAFNDVAAPWGYWNCEHLQPWRSIDRAHSLACMVDQSLYWHQAILTSRNLWPLRVKFRIYLIAIDTEYKDSQYKEIYLAAIDSTAWRSEFKRSTLRCWSISLVGNVLIGNELWLSSTQPGMGLRFLLPRPSWSRSIPTTSHLRFNTIGWMFYCVTILCSDCLLFKMSKLQQSLMVQIPVCLLVWFSSLGIKKWLLWTVDTTSKVVNFLSLKSSSSGLLLRTSSTQCHFSVFAMRRNCGLEILPAFDVCIAARSELVLSVGIQLDLSELQPGDYTYLFYWHQSGYLFTTDVDVMECGMGTSKLGVIWDPGGLLLVAPYPVLVSVHAPSPGRKHGMHVLKTATIKRTAVGMKHGGGNDIAIDLALLPWDPGSSTRHCKFSLGYNQKLFKEGGVSQLWPPLLSKSLLATSTSSDFDQVHAISDYYLGNASFDLAQVYFDKGYHHDYTSTKEGQVPWDPGGNTSASAWGQAGFQGGRIVSDQAKAAIGWGLGHRKRA